MKTTILSILLAIAMTAAGQKYVGGDISMLTKYENASVVYKDKDGNTVQPLPFFKEEGLNAMRVRLFVDPSQDTDKAVCQDLDYVKALGKRIKDQGMAFLLDFHYSDTWADPGKQWTPNAWKDLSNEQLYEQIYTYTKECLQQLKAAGATPDFIQTGNEISYGMMWGTKAAADGNNTNRCYTNSPDANWNRFMNLLKKAGQACREECPNAKIILHSERTPKPVVLTDFFNRMKNASIDYDIIGLSYYPEHHGNLATLETALTTLENKNYGKDIWIVETGYSYAWSIGGEYDYTGTYPFTEEGQRKFTADLVTKLNSHPLVKGLFWWWPEDNGNKNVTSKWWNAALYNHDTGKPYAAFYELKNFRGKVAVVKKAGTLASLISAEEKDNLTELIVTGKLHGDDLIVLRYMTGCDEKGKQTNGKLKRLDMSAASIVAGGELYVNTPEIYDSYGNRTTNGSPGGFQYRAEKDVLGSYLFAGCDRLEEILLPESITAIGDNVFHFGNNLKQLMIPKNVQSIGSLVFFSCEKLTSLTVDEANPYLTSPEGSNAICNGTTIVSGCDATTIPEGITIIGKGSLAGLGSWGAKLKLPSTIQKIEERGLHSTNYGEIVLPDGLKFIGQEAFGWSNINTLTIPGSVEHIGQAAFSDLRYLNNVFSYIKDPSIFPEDAFKFYDGFDQLGATLYVPYGTKEAYAASVGCRHFPMIIEMAEETGIHAVKHASTTDTHIYNLNGQRIAKGKKGLYIINGYKKIIIR